MSLQEIVISRDKNFLINSKNFVVVPDKKYLLSIDVTGIKGEPFCACIGVVMLNDDNKEVERRIRWLNDFSGTKRIVNLLFRAITNKVVIIYRINVETPVRADSHFLLKPIDDIDMSEADINAVESDDNDLQYSIERVELTSEQELMLEKNIVWILASPRSGTTWLGTQLLSHNTQMINELNLSEHLGTTVWGITDKIVRNIDYKKNHPEYFFSTKYRNTWLYFLRKLILNRIYAQCQDLTRKIMIKEPTRIPVADLISECFPLSKIIIMLRDPRDVIDSTVDSRTENSWQVKGGLTPIDENMRLDFISYHARRLVNVIENLLNAYERHPENLRFIVRYEDLRKNTVNELGKIYKFIEVDISKEELEKIVSKYSYDNIPPEKKGKGKFVRIAKPGEWAKNLTEQEKSEMNSILKDTLKKMNYDT